MKKTIIFIAALLAITSIMFSTCSDDLDGGETAIISISISGGTDKAAVNINELDHIIKLYGPTGMKEYNISGQGIIKATVYPGRWQIDVEGYLRGALYSMGSAVADVKAGRNNTVEIQMVVVWVDSLGGSSGGGGGGVVNIPKSTPAAPYRINLNGVNPNNTIPGETFGYSSVNSLVAVVNNSGTQPTGPLTVDLNGSDAGSFILTYNLVSAAPGASITIPDIASGANETFDVTPDFNLSMGTYTATVDVTGANGLTATFNVSFTVSQDAPAPTITTQPTGGTFETTDTVGLSVSATYSGSVSYQWYYNTTNSNTGGIAASGISADTDSYSFSVLDMNVGDTRYYYCVVTNTDPSYNGNTTTSIASNTAAVAVKQKFPVTFNANGGSGTPPTQPDVFDGDSITLPGQGGLSRTGYSFSGWAETAPGSSNYSAGASYTVTATTTFNARWTATPYNITYNVGVASGVTHSNPGSYTITSTTITLVSPTTVTSGHVFDGWYNDSAFTSPATSISSGSTGDRTFYAKWQSYTVNYDGTTNGGTVNPPSSTFYCGVTNYITTVDPLGGGNASFRISDYPAFNTNKYLGDPVSPTETDALCSPGGSVTLVARYGL